MAIYKLKEIGSFKGGFSKLIKNNYDIGVKFINYMDVFNNFYINDKTKLRLYNASQKEIQKYRANYGDAIFTSSSETKKEIAMSSVYLSDDINIVNGFSKIYKYNQDILLPHFASYLFRSNEFREKIKKYATGFTRYNISSTSLENIEIYIPSLETQRSIIEIIKQKEKLFLNFSELVRLNSLENTQNDMKALIEIIEPLKKQIDLINLKLYLFKKYCQNKIKLIFDQNSFFTKYNLQDLFDINRGKIINSKYLNDNKGKYPVISSNTKNNGIFGYINNYMYNGEYITVSADGAYAGTIFYQNGKFSITNVCFILKPKVKKLFYLKFVFAYLKSIEQNIKKECSVGSSRPAVREYSLKNVKINLPSLEIQQSLISISELYV